MKANTDDFMLSPNLLQPGWAGELFPDELAFIKSVLKKDRRFRARWGMGKGTGRINDEKIHRVAMHGVEALQEYPSEDFGASVQLRLVDAKEETRPMSPVEETVAENRI